MEAHPRHNEHAGAFTGIGVELGLSAWVSVSLLLLGNAMLLYHMVRKASLVMSERTAAVLTILLLIGAIAVLMAATVGYAFRMGAVRKTQTVERRRDETVIGAWVAVAVFAILAVLCAVCYVLLRGSVRSFLGLTSPPPGQAGNAATQPDAGKV